MTDDVFRVAVLTVPCLFGLWTAIACRQAQYHGLPGSDALVWAGLSGAFFLLSLMKTARGLGLLRGLGAERAGRRAGPKPCLPAKKASPLSKRFLVRFLPPGPDPAAPPPPGTPPWPRRDYRPPRRSGRASAGALLDDLVRAQQNRW